MSSIRNQNGTIGIRSDLSPQYWIPPDAYSLLAPFSAFEISPYTIEDTPKNEAQESTPASLWGYAYDSIHWLSEKTGQLSSALTKDQVDDFLVTSITLPTYAIITAPLAKGTTSLEIKAGLSVAGKLFMTVVNPAVAQFVSDITEAHSNNAKYSYYTMKCLLQGEYCEERSQMDALNSHTVLHDVSQFDTTTYLEQISNGLSHVFQQDLYTLGMISAVSTDLRDLGFNMMGLTEHCQGYFCKNWISFYTREWIKGGIKELTKPPSPSPLDMTSESDIQPSLEVTPLSKISLEDVISVGSHDLDIQSNSTAPQLTSIAQPICPIMEPIVVQVETPHFG